MAVRSVNDEAISYIANAISDAGGPARQIHKNDISKPFVFAPTAVSYSDLEKFDCGGIASQADSDAELAVRLRRYGAYNGNLKAVFHDPGARKGDLTYIGSLPDFLIETESGNYFISNCEEITAEWILDCRSMCVGYIKILYLINTQANMRQFSVSLAGDLLESELIEIYVNCYDDESWLGAGLNS